jgi:cellulose synthase/poly-beta-1,6-N-acetylglucosamine synthase-like glycosyltransferase
MSSIASRITTIIPTYRRPMLLRRAVESALVQDGVSLTVCVFDNASGDETGEVISSMAAHDARLQYYCHEQNIGAAANFEFGLHSVTTPFFSILSDDDYLLPGFYQRALDALDKNPKAMFWAGLTLNIDEVGRIWDARVDRWPREGCFLPPDGMMEMMHGMAPTWTGIVFRREILDRIGLPDKETLGPSDLDFTLKAAAASSFILCKHPSAVFTLNPSSFSATQPLSSFWPGWQKLFKNIETNKDLSPQAKMEALAALHVDARRMLIRRAANALAAGRYDFARATAAALYAEYRVTSISLALKSIALICERLPWAQRIYTFFYRQVENGLVKSRADLEPRFGYLIKRG